MKKFSKILITLLVLSLLCGVFVIAAFADEAGGRVSTAKTYTKVSVANPDTGCFDITNATYVDENGETQNVFQWMTKSATASANAWFSFADVTVGNYDTESGAYQVDIPYVVLSFDITSATGVYPIDLSLKFKVACAENTDKYGSASNFASGTAAGNWAAIHLTQFNGEEAYTWHNVSIVYDIVNSKVNIFIDGVLDNSFTLGDAKIYGFTRLAHFEPDSTKAAVLGSSLVLGDVDVSTYTEAGYLAPLFENGATLNGSELNLDYTGADDLMPAKTPYNVGEGWYMDIADAIAALDETNDTVMVDHSVAASVYIDTPCKIDTQGKTFNFTYDTEAVSYKVDSENENLLIFEEVSMDDLVYVYFYDTDGNLVYDEENDMDFYVAGLEGSKISANVLPEIYINPKYNFLGWSYAADGEPTWGDITVVYDGESVDDYGAKCAYLYPITEELAGKRIAADGTVTKFYPGEEEALQAAIDATAAGDVFDIYVDVYAPKNKVTGDCTYRLYGVTMLLVETYTTTSSNGLFSGSKVVVEGITVDGVNGKFKKPNWQDLRIVNSTNTNFTFKNIEFLVYGRWTDHRFGTILFEDCPKVEIKSANNMGYGGSNNTAVMIFRNSVVHASYKALWAGGREGANNSCKLRFEGTTKVIAVDGKSVIGFGNGQATDGASLYIGKDVTFEGATDIFNNENPNLLVYIEEGFTFDTPLEIDLVSSSTFRTETGAQGYFKAVDGKYVYTKAAGFYDLTLIINGVTTTINCVVDGGYVPATPESFYSKIVGGVPYVKNFSHWSLTDGGEATTPDWSKAGTYYAVFDEVVAAWAVYGTSGAVSSASSSTTVKSEVLTAGVTLKLFADVELVIDASATIGANVTVDLGGKTMESTGAGRYLNPVNLTYKNGTLIFANDQNNLIFSDSATTKVTFKDMTIVSGAGYAFIDARDGNYTYDNCIINFDHADREENNRLMSIGYVAANSSGTPTVNFINTTVNMTNTTDSEGVNDQLISFSPRSNAVITLTATINVIGCTFNTGINYPFVVQAATLHADANCVANINVEDSTFDTATKVVINSTADFDVTVNLKGDVSFGCNYFGTAKVVSAEGKTLVEKDGAYVTAKATLPILANLTLYNDMDLNFFLRVDTVGVTKVTIDGVEFDLTKAAKTNWGGVEYYRIPVKGVAANAAAGKSSTLVVSATVNGVVTDVTVEYSVVKYLTTVVNGEYTAEAKALVANTANYIKAAYDFAGTELPEAFATLVASEEYLALAENFNTDAIPESDADKGTIGNAVASVQFNLASALKYRFNLKADFSGTITVNGVEYVVEAGQVDGKTYIEVNELAFKLYDNNVVFAGDVEGEYDLAAYVNGDKVVEGDEAKLNALLLALYNYSAAASAYEATQSR